MEKNRNYGIDLLKIVFMYMVCLLHILGQGGVLDNCITGTMNHKVFWGLEVFSFCAVDGFAFISGYTATNKPQKYDRIVRMWFQAVFYSFVLTAIFTVVGIEETWSVREVIKCALPVTFTKFWYFTAFFCMFFAVPVLNIFLFGIDENTAKKYFVGLLILFSGMGCIDSAFGLGAGYSALWLIVLYCLGVLSKRIRLFETRRSITLICLWICCLLPIWFLKVFAENDRFLSYLSPPVLCSGIIMVILFSRLKLKGGIIRKISPLVFGIYLFQLNQVVWDTLLCDSVSFIASKGTFAAVMYIIVAAFVLFASGLIVEFIRSKIECLLRISELSHRIATAADIWLKKAFVLLK